MELDDLKYQLKSRLATDHSGRSDTDIAALLTKNTSSITGKLKRSLWYEIISGLVIIIGLAWVSLETKYDSIRLYFTVFTILFAAFVILALYLLKRITRLSAGELPVKSNLQAIVKILEEFTKRYFQFTMALIPVCFVFAYIVNANENQRIPAFEHLSNSRFDTAWKILAFLGGYFILLSIVVWYFTKWYLKKLYGNYIAQLKQCINELREEAVSY